MYVVRFLSIRKKTNHNLPQHVSFYLETTTIELWLWKTWLKSSTSKELCSSLYSSTTTIHVRQVYTSSLQSCMEEFPIIMHAHRSSQYYAPHCVLCLKCSLLFALAFLSKVLCEGPFDVVATTITLASCIPPHPWSMPLAPLSLWYFFLKSSIVCASWVHYYDHFFPPIYRFYLFALRVHVAQD